MLVWVAEGVPKRQPRPRDAAAEAKANRARLFATRRFDCDARSGAAPEEGETLPDPDQGPEADMDEPEDEEPTTAEMNEFFDAITAMG